MFTDPNSAAVRQAPEASPARKFMFDRSFDDAAVVHRAAERKPVLMKPEQIDALKKESYDAGVEAGKAAAQEKQAADMAALLASIDGNIAALVDKIDLLAAEQVTHTRQLVLAVAKKILPEFTARGGLAEIEAVLATAIRDMAREPRLVVRVHEQQFDAVNEKAQAIAAQRAYNGKVIVLADPDVMSGDCRVEWADGGVERKTEATWRAVEETINPTV